MKRKKILALLMVAALCVGTVAGCGSKDTESSKSESGKNENSESSTGDSKDDLSPITFKYYNADGKNGNWENPVAQAITEAPHTDIRVFRLDTDWQSQRTVRIRFVQLNSLIISAPMRVQYFTNGVLKEKTIL